MTTLRNTLFNSLLRKENICCLCLNVAEQNTILIRDEVLLNGNDFECNVFSEILGYILGDDKCRANFQSFNQVLESLDKCLQDASEQINMCKSLFVVLDPNDAAQHYYDYKRPIATQAVALKRFNSILSGKNSKPNLEIKNEDDFDGNSEDPPFNEDVIKVKETKKKRARKTVNLPRELILHEDSQPLAYKCNKHKQRHGNPNKQPARVDKARPQLEKAKPGLRKLLIDNSKNPDFIIGTSFTLIS
ncbi:hypothetical protein MSG28_015822 [Choristoneura fumiferana]|uniref:Uncharacterized protein n=1 Tax=Choristoneura fumiferana TaxID=7141 RepID=A0ACC0KCB0_CHOFU|nr:hypothetical protein MSG28_015822 [Choristoneura fumiferana]